jgi:integrase
VAPNGVPRRPRLPISYPEQLSAFLSQPDDTWTGKQDHCLMAVLLDTGIRVSHATGLKEP